MQTRSGGVDPRALAAEPSRIGGGGRDTRRRLPARANGRATAVRALPFAVVGHARVALLAGGAVAGEGGGGQRAGDAASLRAAADAAPAHDRKAARPSAPSAGRRWPSRPSSTRESTRCRYRCRSGRCARPDRPRPPAPAPASRSQLREHHDTRLTSFVGGRAARAARARASGRAPEPDRPRCSRGRRAGRRCPHTPRRRRSARRVRGVAHQRREADVADRVARRQLDLGGRPAGGIARVDTGTVIPIAPEPEVWNSSSVEPVAAAVVADVAKHDVEDIKRSSSSSVQSFCSRSRSHLTR